MAPGRVSKGDVILVREGQVWLVLLVIWNKRIFKHFHNAKKKFQGPLKYSSAKFDNFQTFLCKYLWNQSHLRAMVFNNGYVIKINLIIVYEIWSKKYSSRRLKIESLFIRFRLTSVICRRGKKLEGSWLWIWEEPISGFSWSTSARTRSSTWSQKSFPSPMKSWQGKL